MNPEDVASVLDEIGERVGPLGAQTAEILVRGTFAESMVGAIAGAVVVMFSFVAFGLLVIGLRDDNGDMVGFSLIAGVFLLIIGMVILFSNLTGVIAPDYVAIKRVLEAVAGAR